MIDWPLALVICFALVLVGVVYVVERSKKIGEQLALDVGRLDRELGKLARDFGDFKLVWKRSQGE